MAESPPTPPRDGRAAGEPSSKRDDRAAGHPAASAANVPGLEMRLSVPADGDLGAIAAELAVKVAEFLGGDAGSIGATLDGLTSRVATAGEDVTFEFRHVGCELVIQARCNGRSSEARHPLPA
jgi:hypothetical protein